MMKPKLFPVLYPPTASPASVHVIRQSWLLTGIVSALHGCSLPKADSVSTEQALHAPQRGLKDNGPQQSQSGLCPLVLNSPCPVASG